MSDTQRQLLEAAERVGELLQSRDRLVVFAESCTGGLLSTTLTSIPGISSYHCGSAVVYRLDTKTQWLGVPAEMLEDPGPVSEIVARRMVEGVLAKTPEAHCAAAITGHLGPNAPEGQDGLFYVGIAERKADESVEVVAHKCWLNEPEPVGATQEEVRRKRLSRQREAAARVFQLLADVLEAAT